MIPFLMDAGAAGFSSGDLTDEQDFTTAGTFSWTKPTPDGYAIIELWAGGGSGGCGYNGGTYGYGGDGGDYKRYRVDLTAISDTLQVIVGNKGITPPINGTQGYAGSYSAFAGAIWAQAGKGGSGQTGPGGTPMSYSPPNSAAAYVLQTSESGGSGQAYPVAGDSTTNSGAGGGGTRNNGGGLSSPGGDSVNGGDGGDGYNYPSTRDGEAPGGGGGGGILSSGGDGAIGRVRVRCYAN